MVKFFECHWAKVVQRGMFPLTIIEQLKVLENVRLGFFSRFIVLVENPFSFQLAEEAFDRRVIPAVAFAAHAASDVMVLQKLSEGIGRILTALLSATTFWSFVREFSSLKPFTKRA